MYLGTKSDSDKVHLYAPFSFLDFALLAPAVISENDVHDVLPE